MTLNEKQKDLLRQIKIYDYAFRENKRGQPLDSSGKKFMIPSWTDLFSDTCKSICQAGFSKVEQVVPDKANCIIRIFEKRHFNYENTCCPIIFNLYGVLCFTKNEDGKWMTKNTLSGEGGHEFEINFSECFVITSLWHENIKIDVDFFDIYVVVS